MKDIQQQTKQENQKNTPLIRRIFTKRYMRIIIGIIVGACIGLFYWEYIGCNGGSCPLTSSPTKTVVLFGMMGGWFSFR